MALTFDDVAIVPQCNNVESRTIPDLSSWLTKSVTIGMPLIPANMDTVIGPELAEVIIANGGIPIFHRFASLETQLEWVKRFGSKMFISTGVGKPEVTFRLLEEGAGGVTIDVAHGHSTVMFEVIKNIKAHFPSAQVIAGNICSPMAYQDLVNAGADAVKVGIGPGAACTTRVVTGFGVPQFSAIYECAKVAQKLRVPIIADGGIRNSRDVVLALAAGASSVMIGKLFALTEESAAEKRHSRITVWNFKDDSETAIEPMEPAEPEAKYRGQASEDFQNEYYGGLKEKTVAEGTDFWAPISGPAQKLIDEILGGLRSGLTYGGAKNIKELQRKAEFVRVTPSYSTESNPRR